MATNLNAAQKCAFSSHRLLSTHHARCYSYEQQSGNVQALRLCRRLHICASAYLLCVLQATQGAQVVAAEYSECLLRTGGLACAMVQSMTSTTSDTAEQRPPVLQGLTKDAQDHSIEFKNNIERIVWEFLTNRTFVGEPQNATDKDGNPVGCDPDTNKCRDGLVRTPATPLSCPLERIAVQGQCYFSTVQKAKACT